MIICLHDKYESSHDHPSVAILAQEYCFFFFWFSCKPFFAMPAMKAMKTLRAMKFTTKVMKAMKAKKAKQAMEAAEAAEAQAALWRRMSAVVRGLVAAAEELDAAEEAEEAAAALDAEELDAWEHVALSFELSEEEEEEEEAEFVDFSTF